MNHFPLPPRSNLLVFSHASSPTRAKHMDEATLGSDLLFVLAALVCALICGLGLTSLLSCALRCSRRMVLDSSDGVAIRVVNSRLKEAMEALPIVVYTATSNPPGVATDCPICLGEFVDGEHVRVLPKCNHCFHLECIDKWLVSNSSCPICRHSLNLHNRTPGGAAIAEATESNNAMHIAIDTTDSTQAIGVVPLSTETLERTPQDEAAITIPSRLHRRS